MFKNIFALILFFVISPAFSNPYYVNLNWFDNFGDPVLKTYICEAFENNKDMKIAILNISKYRQEKNLNISKEFPNVGVGASYLLLKVPELAIPDNDIQTNSFALPFIATWEIDYLLKNYDKIKRAKTDIENSLYKLKLTGINLAVELAQAYFGASNLNKQIELQTKTVSLSKKIFAMREKMLKAGVISETELNIAKNNLLTEQNKLLQFEKEKEFFLTKIAYLTGKSPDNSSEIKITPFDEIEYKGTYPNVLKGDIIENRPDIIMAENEIKKAKIDITIAKKDFLPNINIMGILVFSTFVVKFDWQNAFAALNAGAFQTIFDGGKRIFNLKKRKIEYEIAVEKYLKADLNALKEVNDALYTLKKDFENFNNNKEKSEVENSNFINVFKSYSEGIKSKEDYLNENSDYIKTLLTLNNSKNQNFINLLSLYKAVGGAL